MKNRITSIGWISLILTILATTGPPHSFFKTGAQVSLYASAQEAKSQEEEVRTQEAEPQEAEPQEAEANAEAQAQVEPPALTTLNIALSNAKPFPLIGVGIGNLDHERIPSIISSSLSPELNYRLIDTAHSSKNEKLLSQSLTQHGLLRHKQQDSPEVHVVTKVWYTHLGYERTKLAVLESLSDLFQEKHKLNLRVHVLLHWPRCDDEAVPWMKCKEEEEALSPYVKDVGPSPLLDRETAFLDSWRALEDLYMSHEQIAGIGVSNFAVRDWELLLRVCRIVPHLHQGNIWSFFFDPELIHMLRANGVMFQAYNVMNWIVSRIPSFPRVHSHLNDIAFEIGGEDLDVSTLILAWFLQRGVGVVARTTSDQNLAYNSPEKVGRVPIFDKLLNRDVEELLMHVLHSEDVHEKREEGVMATFTNKLSIPVRVFWQDRDGGRVAVTSYVQPGMERSLKTHPGHEFLVENTEDGEIIRAFRVEADYGQNQIFHIEL